MGIQKRVTLNDLMDNDTCINFWNPATKTIVGTADNARRASNILGCHSSTVGEALKHKRRLYHPGLQIEVALRYGKKENMNEQKT